MICRSVLLTAKVLLSLRSPCVAPLSPEFASSAAEAACWADCAFAAALAAALAGWGCGVLLVVPGTPWLASSLFSWSVLVCEPRIPLSHSGRKFPVWCRWTRYQSQP